MSAHELAQLRQQIDGIDDQLLALLSQRAELATRVADVKTQSQAPEGHFHRPAREAQVLRRLLATNPGPLENGAVSRVFREIMSACLALEKPLTVAYRLHYSPADMLLHMALIQHFGQGVHPVGFAKRELAEAGGSWLAAVEQGEYDYGMLPRYHFVEPRQGLTTLLQHPKLWVSGEVSLQRDWHAPAFQAWVVSRAPVPPSGRDRTQLYLATNNKPGALQKILHVIADAGVNLHEIESSPGLPPDHAPGFYLALDGHREDAELAAAIGRLKAVTVALRVLGSYPQEIKP